MFCVLGAGMDYPTSCDSGEVIEYGVNCTKPTLLTLDADRLW